MSAMSCNGMRRSTHPVAAAARGISAGRAWSSSAMDRACTSRIAGRAAAPSAPNRTRSPLRPHLRTRRRRRRAQQGGRRRAVAADGRARRRCYGAVLTDEVCSLGRDVDRAGQGGDAGRRSDDHDLEATVGPEELHVRLGEAGGKVLRDHDGSGEVRGDRAQHARDGVGAARARGDRDAAGGEIEEGRRRGFGARTVCTPRQGPCSSPEGRAGTRGSATEDRTWFRIWSAWTWLEIDGFASRSSAPRFTASNTSSESGPTGSPVTTRIGTGASAMSSSIVSSPSTPGMSRSIVTRSGATSFAMATAA